MRISVDILRGYHPGLPERVRDVRMLLDDIGIEVKRTELSAEGGERGARLGLELLANRGDHRCYLGIAREVAGRIGGEVRAPELQAGVWEGAHGDAAVEVRIEVPEGLCYAGVPLRLTGAGELPAETLAVLEAAGLKRVHPVVDVTNVVNLEIGQPLHAFDAAKVRGAIRVRYSGEGERAWPLFAAEPVALPAGLLVIADDEKVLAVAGVIGCEDSKVDAQTRDIILESACFDPVLVHKASRKLGIHSDASARFERGADPAMARTGVERAIRLLQGVAEQSGPAAVAQTWDGAQAVIPLSLWRLDAWYGLELSRAAVAARLEPMGFLLSAEAGPARALQVTVPTWRRWDVRSPEDLYEEFGRASSYDALPAALPPVGLGAVPTPAERLRERIEAVLVGAGFYEVITDGFYGRGDLEPIAEALSLPADHALRVHVEMLNSLDRGWSLLKNTGLIQALAGLTESQSMQIEDHRVFEFTRTFHPDPAAPSGACRERPLLWALICGPERSADWAHRPGTNAADIFLMKGLVREFAAEAGVDLTLSPTGDRAGLPLADALHPHRQLQIFSGDRPVGVLGEIHPRLSKGRRGRPIYLELDIAALSPASEQPVTLPPLRPWSERNLAFTLPLGMASAELLEAMQAAHTGRITPAHIDITDLYAHEEDLQPVRTLTTRLRYQNDDSAFSVEDINQTTKQIAAQTVATLSSKGVKLRA